MQISSPFTNAPETILINTFLLGITSGFMAVSASSCVPGRLQTHEKEFGGMVTGLSICLGSLLGSLIGLLAFRNLKAAN